MAETTTDTPKAEPRSRLRMLVISASVALLAAAVSVLALDRWESPTRAIDGVI